MADSKTEWTERPILFSAPMVRAILDGDKTQTRRVVKTPLPHGPFDCGWSGTMYSAACEPNEHGARGCTCKPIRPFYGFPGDRLWVRETWSDRGDNNVAYRATNNVRVDGVMVNVVPTVDKWQPSIYMPRWASRITLEVTGVGIERLQDITEEDARSEGVRRDSSHGEALLNIGDKYHAGMYVEPRREDETLSEWGKRVWTFRNHFAALWDSINAKRGYGWDKNPWVWVIEFKLSAALGPRSKTRTEAL